MRRWLGAWAVAPSFAGLFMAGGSLAAPLVVGATMKIAYDLLLYRAFRRLPPPEERDGAGAPPQDEHPGATSDTRREDK